MPAIVYSNYRNSGVMFNTVTETVSDITHSVQVAGDVIGLRKLVNMAVKRTVA